MFRKSLVSVKFSAPNSGAGNGGANFMGTWKNAFFLQKKAMSIKFLGEGGGGILGFFGGGECRLNFSYGCEDFSDMLKRENACERVLLDISRTDRIRALEKLCLGKRLMGSQHPSPSVKNFPQLCTANLARNDHITRCRKYLFKRLKDVM